MNPKWLRLQVRIVPPVAPDDPPHQKGAITEPGMPGDLQVSGPSVFKEYIAPLLRACPGLTRAG